MAVSPRWPSGLLTGCAADADAADHGAEGHAGGARAVCGARAAGQDERAPGAAGPPGTHPRPAPRTDADPDQREQFFISHHHSLHADDPDADDADAGTRPTSSSSDSSAASFASVVIRKQAPTPSLQPSPFPFYAPAPAPTTVIPHAVVARARAFAAEVSISTEIRRYMLDIVLFLRMHRAVATGSVSALATLQFEALVRCLAPLHDFDFATPALVGLAVFKVYAHKVELVGADGERSLMYGSDRVEVERYLEQVDVEAVIEDVLASVKAPL